MRVNNIPVGLVAAIWLGVVCTGCALAPENTAEAREEKQYRTGSHLPVKDSQATDVKQIDPNTIQTDRPRPVGGPGVRGG
jgi:hypothetical protein